MAFLIPKVVRDVVENAVINTCTFENDTSYPVTIIQHDETRILKPGMSQSNWLITGFSLDLIMKLPGGESSKNFPSNKFGNRRHKMSSLFKDPIRATEVRVVEAYSIWELQSNHPGGYEEKMSTKVETKNSWKKMQEKGNEAEAKVSGMIQAIELSASFKAYTKMTRVDEFEKRVTKNSEYVLKDRSYFWQEMIIIQTNQEKPYKELVVPTPHTEVMYTTDKPGKELLMYCK